MQQQGQFALADFRPPGGHKTEHAWLNYPAGVAWAMQEAGHSLTGIDVVFTSTVPIGAGVSSSAAVEAAFILAWEALSGLTLSTLDKARLGQRSENGFLGVQSGIMDQYASLHGAENQLILLDCRSLTHELIPFPAGTSIVVADSGIRRQLAHSEYNTRRQQCEQAVALLQPYLPGLRALRDLTPADLQRYAHRLPGEVRRRARHVVEECQRVLAGAEALRQGDLTSFGQAVNQSHISCRDLYEISILELDVLAATAWEVPGCYGARLTGAGFGGCVIAIANNTAVPALSQALTTAYRAEFGREPQLFTAQVAAGAAATSAVHHT
jgi:galactokinase